MLTVRLLVAALALSFVSTKLTTCRSPGDGGKGPAASSEPVDNVDLPGVATSELTVREKREWSALVSEQLAPCPDQPVSVAQCVKESRDCKGCAPAAGFFVRLVRRGKTRSQIETAYKLRFGHDQVKQIALGDSPTKGPAGATVTIVEWADFECPFCAATDPAIDKLLEKYPDRVRLVFKNYPLSIHEHAEKAARAAMAANKQGKFWELHHLMFEATRKNVKLTEPTVGKLAKQAGLDMQRFTDDANSEAVADVVAKDRKQGDALDLKGTPLIYVNGRHFDLDYFDIREDLEPWIQLELELAGKPSKARALPPPSASAPPRAAPSGVAKDK